ncbi:hypothetical protein [Geodermatophilus sp. DSM 44513]|uniref:hypothetical protein n=1 Tax=Geodermatophilus sp. DSM 44513 TaxID=1528104 RepID=UPI00126D5FCD|nr:hypothetical protein [Geodermatophilus sp. DSM 44513]WNV76886.1 hypothetical protein RTG05_06315 [Geodermatophilus sp. DSM 44513]
MTHDPVRPAPDDDERRWTDALSLLSGVPAGTALRRLGRARRNLLLAVLVPLVVLCVVVGVLVGYVVLRQEDGADDPSPGPPAVWQEVVGFALMAAGLVLLGLALVRQLRAARARRTGWHSPLLALTGHQRRQLLAQVRGRVPADPARLPLARVMAAQLRDQRAVPWLLAGQTLLWVGQAVLGPTWPRVALAASFVVGWLVVGLLIRRDARRADAFLAAHPE